MTVPKGAPKNVEWADRMRQALQIAGSNVESLEDLFPKGHNRIGVGHNRIGVRFNGIKNALSKLDVITDEIANMSVHTREEILAAGEKVINRLWEERTTNEEATEIRLSPEMHAKVLLWREHESRIGGKHTVARVAAACVVCALVGEHAFWEDGGCARCGGGRCEQT